MGCDGGTIPKRYEVVKVKEKEKKLDEATVERIRWEVCAMSQERLRDPIVCDELGNILNRETVLEALLEKTMPKQFKHIRSTKDLIAMKLEKNPNFTDDQKSNRDETQIAAFICPISGLETNGRHRFSCLRACGHVLSEKALKEIPSQQCIICQAAFTADDVIPLNPSAEVMESRREKLKERQAAAKAEKKASRKEKKEEKAADGAPAAAVASKKRKEPTPASASASSSIALPTGTSVDIGSTVLQAGSSHAALAQKSDVYRSLFAPEKRQKTGESENPADAYLVRGSMRAYV